MLETVVVLRQTLETATDSPPAVDTEPTLPAPETLGAQFNHRYKMTYFFSPSCFSPFFQMQSSITGRHLPYQPGKCHFETNLYTLLWNYTCTYYSMDVIINMPACLCLFVFCRTVFILSEALDEQLKTLWFSPFQTDDIEADLDLVSVYALSIHYGKNVNPTATHYCLHYWLICQWM